MLLIDEEGAVFFRNSDMTRCLPPIFGGRTVAALSCSSELRLDPGIVIDNVVASVDDGVDAADVVVAGDE